MEMNFEVNYQLFRLSRYRRPLRYTLYYSVTVVKLLVLFWKGAGECEGGEPFGLLVHFLVSSVYIIEVF